MHVRRTSRLLLATLATTACAADVREKPSPPDLSALEAAYASPTRAFDAEAAIEVEQLIEAKAKALVNLEHLGVIAQSLLSGLAEEDGAAARVTGIAPIVFEGEGYARIERICTGHGEPTPPIDKASNGHIELTAGYSEQGLDPVLFGGAFACQEQAGNVRLALAGQMALSVGDNLKLAELNEPTPVLFDLSGFSFRVNDVEVVSGGFDFQVCRGEQTHCAPGHLEVLVSLTSGTLVWFFAPSDGGFGFRAANGRWTCDAGAATCSDGAGATVAIPEYEL